MSEKAARLETLEDTEGDAEAEVVALSARVTTRTGRSKLVRLKEARRIAQEKSAKAREKKEERRAGHVAADRTKALTSTDVRAWFEKAAKKFCPQLSRVPSWTVKDKVNAKRLLAEFGAKTTMDGVAFMWEHWEGYRTSSNGRLNGVPTPSLMYAMRGQVFTDMELGNVPGAPKNRTERVQLDEFDEDRDASCDGYGWG